MDFSTGFLGGMLGGAVGDALGELAFRYPRQADFDVAVEERETLIYTDDTAMALALAGVLIDTGSVDSEQLGDAFRTEFEREPWRGYGPGPPAIFAAVAHGMMPYERAAQTLYGGHGSLGNGAAMRIAPLGLFFFDCKRLYEKAERSARVTHTHRVGVDGAAVQAQAVALATTHEPGRDFDPAKFIEALVGFARTPEIRHKLEQVAALLVENVAPAQAAQRLGLSIAVHESMPFSLYSFLRHPGSFQDCLYCAIFNGGDRDTMGAMAGAISGAYLGTGAVPAVWRQKLENREHIESLAQRLWDRRKRERHML
ncbi:MAG: ADP-ribosylglycohydrolase family protein [Acidiferrobacterales bacterium]